jgi:uncharacterized protein YgiM (DUF1202 family)
VKLRKENDASADAYGQIKSGTVVYALDAQGSWYKALYLGYTGYVPKDALTAKKPTPTPTPTPKPTPTPAPDAAYAKAKTRLYKRASTSNQIATIPKGASSSVLLRQQELGQGGLRGQDRLRCGQVPVRRAGGDRHAHAVPDPHAQAHATPAPSAAYAKVKTRLYKRASTASQKITLPKGAEVLQSFYKSGKWAKVRYKSRTGYVLLKYLSGEPLATSTPEPTPTPSPTPAPTATPSPYQQLSPGDTGNAVKKMQTRLKALGWFGGTIGGNYLTRTTQAVKDFRTRRG